MIEVTGVAEFVADLARLAPTVTVAGHTRLSGAASRIASDARGRAPYLTGKLRAGITVRTTATTVAVVSSAPHARIIESGGRHPVYGRGMVTQAAHPYMAPALEAGGDDVDHVALGALDEALAVLRL